MTTLYGNVTQDPDYQLGMEKLGAEKEQWSQKLDFWRQLMGQRGTATGQISELADQYNRSYAEAQAANEAKYRQQLGLVDQVSGQGAADIRSDYTKQRSSALQNLARSGMSGTTVGATLSQGLGREQTSALNRLSDQMLGTKLGVMKDYKYEGPDTGVLQTLISTLGGTLNFNPNL
jgi:hypothetical protein